jgi:hypothetical protein
MNYYHIKEPNIVFTPSFQYNAKVEVYTKRDYKEADRDEGYRVLTTYAMSSRVLHAPIMPRAEMMIQV